MTKNKGKQNNKKNIFKIILSGIGGFFIFIFYIIGYALIKLFVRCKTIGKENVSKNDEARVFIMNHYEIYGPIATFMRFPYKFRPWVIDKMTKPETVEEQMSIGIYGKFPKYPKWFKTIVIKTLKNVVLYIMNKRAKAISVSRENPRANIETMLESVKTLEKGTNIIIWPELSYVEEGVGNFQTGFEHLAKYYYQKTGKHIAFYPVFTSKKNKTFYIEKPITFDETNDPNEEKSRITNYLHNTMIKSYIDNEVNNKKNKA